MKSTDAIDLAAGARPAPAAKPKLESILTCPYCGFAEASTMPLDACLYFHECGRCRAILRPKLTDCCVFCSYGSVKCPPEQMRVNASPR